MRYPGGPSSNPYHLLPSLTHGGHMASGGDTVATEATEATAVTAEGNGVTIATSLSCHICHKTSGYSAYGAYSCWNMLESCGKDGVTQKVVIGLVK